MKIAVCFVSRDENARQVCEGMANAQKIFDFQRRSVFDAGSGAIASVETDSSRETIKLRREGRSGNLLLITGAPIVTSGALDEKLSHIVDSGHEEAAKALSELEGAFAAVYWNQDENKLVIVTDILSAQPLFITRTPGQLLLASELKGIAAAPMVDNKICASGWGAFVTFGHFLDQDTSLEGVKRVGPGVVLVYDPATDQLEETTYWKWPKPKPITKMEDVDTDYLLSLLDREIRGYLEYRRPGSILLSGGFDSRLIYALLYRMGLRIPAIVLSHEDENCGADGIYAGWTAKCLGGPVVRHKMNPDFFSTQKYLDYMLMNDVGTPSLYMFIAQASQHLKPELGAIWEGAFIGGTLKQGPGGISRYLANRAALKDKWDVVRKVFDPDLAERMFESFKVKLKTETEKYSDDPFGLQEFVVRNRTRNRYAPNPLTVFSNTVQAYTPGISKDFWELSVALHADLKDELKLMLLLFRRHFPSLLRIPFCGGGDLARPQPSCLLHDAFVIADKLQKMRYTGGIYRRLFKNRSFTQSRFIHPVVARVNPDHPDLNADNVRQIQSSVKRDPAFDSHECRMLFYWRLWRSIMEGEFTSLRTELG